MGSGKAFQQTGSLSQHNNSDFLNTAFSIEEPDLNAASGDSSFSAVSLLPSAQVSQIAGPIALSGPIVATGTAFNYLVSSGNFSINLEFDPAAAGAPTSFQAAIEQAASILVTDLRVTRAITVNLQIQYGENGIGAGSAEAGPSTFGEVSYATIRDDLIANANAGDTNFAALPSGGSILGTDGSTTKSYSLVEVVSAQEKVFGFTSGNASALDGTANFGTGISSTLLQGVALHELTHALGRVPDEPIPSPTPNIFDLFRFASQGTILVDPTTPAATSAYFSVDGGTTSLAAYGTSSDTSDYLNSQSSGTLNDPFTELYSSSTPQALTALDLQQMDVLGFSTACFAEGTTLATLHGSIPVEALRPGMTLLTASGAVRPVRWIGHRRVDLTRHPAPDEVCPIRVRAGALGEGVPRRDLRLSPEHALFLDGGLVPARLLVNGCSIVRETACPHVVWYHVELDTHDLVLAEGAVTETYLDTGNRGLFENAAEPLVLHPRFDVGQAERLARSCAPLLDDPAVVAPIWRRLADFAAQNGFGAVPALDVTSDPSLALHSGDRVFRPVCVHLGRYVFVLPALQAPVRLVSRATSPHALRPWVADRRRLGVSVSHLTVRSGSAEHVVNVDDPGLADGWFAVENDGAGPCRWTNGDAALPLEYGAPAVVELHCAPLPEYLLQPASEARERAAA